MIDIKKAQNEFLEYTKNYDLEDENIKRKQGHSLRVMAISKKIAEKLKLNKEKIELATLIGLLHDIARFRQYTEYQTFKDAWSFDHGDVAVEILEKDDYLRKFIETNKYDDIIKLAIKNHNKFAIEDGLTDEQNKFAKLIRDADKLDIFFIASEVLWKNEREEMENSIINPEIRQTLNEQSMIENNKHKKIEYADSILRMLGYIFDVNFKSSFEIIEQEKYIDRMVNRFKFKDEYTQKEMLDAGKLINQYILNKIQ